MSDKTFVIRTFQKQRIKISAPGPQGAVGPTPDISIGTVATLNAGSPATVTITGSIADPVLNFGIPKGDTGDAFFNLDGGNADSVYGGIAPIDGGGV